MLNVLNQITNYIFPFRCTVCTNLTESKDGICGICWPKLTFISKPYCLICAEKFHVDYGEDQICGLCLSKKPSLEITRAIFEFSPEVKKLIYKFKYNDKTLLGKVFANLLYSRFKNDLDDIDVIIPVPMHKFKRMIRGYNPPQILANELSKIMAKEVNLEVLTKSRLTKNQVGLNRAQRAKNLSGSFKINKKFDLNNKKILLVDDVLTTGATSMYCCKILKKHGAKSVKLATIAKVVFR